MDHVAEVLDSIKTRANSDLPRFSSLFLGSTKEVEPVYFTKPYEDFFWQCATTIPNWLPRVVAACASTEGKGAHALLAIWSRVSGHRTAEAGLLQHAKDEAAHARLFVQLARLAFPENYETGSLDELEQSLQPVTRDILVKSDRDPVSDRMLIDYMMQLNIVEIRTRLHLRMLAPMYYALTPSDKKPRVERILAALERDEMSHITYTACVIEDWASNHDTEHLAGVYTCRLQNYNEHTLDHCDAAKNDYGQGRCPMLFAPSCGGVCKLHPQ